MDAAQGKRKRSGKAREEAKARAIARAEEEQSRELQAPAGEAGEEEGDDGGHEGNSGDDGGDGGDGDDDEKPDLDLLRKRIPQAVKSLLTILKKAKAGETQRVIKKVRFLRGKIGEGGEEGKEAELREMEGQLDALKKIDLHAILAPLLLLKIKKHPFIRPLLPLPDDLFPDVSAGTTTMGEATSAEGKARNRLVSSKGTGEAVAGIVGWCVGVQGGKLKTLANKAKAVAATTTRVGKGMDKPQVKVESRNGEHEETRSTAVTVKHNAAAADDDDDIAAQNAAADAAGWESGDVDDDEDAFDDDDVVSDGESDAGSDVIRDEDYASDLDSGPAAKRRRTAAASSPPPVGAGGGGKQKAGSSMFLPTLASGFTMGDYDSDPDDDERRDKKSGKGGLVQSVRKNRRGQAERRKIWEKKYGSGANHVKKQAEEGVRLEKDRGFLASQMGETAGRGAKWGAKGGPPPTMTTKRAGATDVRDSGWAARPTATTAAPSTVLAKPRKDPPKPATTKTGTEHPSWAAARMRKEKEMAGGAAVAKPKKIVFD